MSNTNISPLTWAKSVLENYEGPPLSNDALARMLFQKLSNDLPKIDSLFENMVRIGVVRNNDVSPVYRTKEDALHQAMWGTYGISGKDPIKFVRLMDCSTEHLLAILRTQSQIDSVTRDIINEILKMRKTA